MNDDQAIVVRLAALRWQAAKSLDLAVARLNCSPDQARDHLLDARAALARASELERQAA